MALYPSILFHFTNFDSLKDILNDAFKPSYAVEAIEFENSSGINIKNQFAVPMVSFCDLRLTEVHSMKTYGKFGIGLTKEWAMENRLQPVFYINESNQLIPRFLDSLKTHFKKTSASAVLSDYEEYNNFFRLQSFLKHYKGDLARPKKDTEHNHLFADEREWRYVPPFNEHDFFLSYVGSEKMVDNWKEEYNKKIPSEYRLKFEPKDIRYLIVENDSNILDLARHLKNVKGPDLHYTEDDMLLLTSRILTYEQIPLDF